MPPSRSSRFALILALGLLAACASSRSSWPRLLVASDLDNMPFAGIDASGEPCGRDVEMMELLCQHAGYQLAWSRLPFAELLPRVAAGRVDVVCATIGITEQRAEEVEFVGPYFETEVVAVVRSGGGEPKDLAELAGRRVAGAAGTTSELAVRERLPEAVLVLENEYGGSALFRLVTGEIDAAVMDGPAAAKLVASSAGRLRRLAESLAAERYALALPKGRPELCVRLSRSLEALRQSGALERLDRSHGLLPDPRD